MPRDLIQHPDPLPIAHPDTVDPDAAVLLRAAEIIERVGWTDGECRNERGNVCILGALWLATGRELPRDSFMFESRHPVLEHLSRRLGFKSSTAAFSWNDKQEDSAPVLTLLRGTAGR